ncbi:MAG: carbohydrate-binding family 9-like protein [Treponema sp.]|nr:carbohydrate-binding family 9-like protein [Treponema sp.]
MANYRIPEPRIARFAPPVYHCRRARGPLTLDGSLDKAFWKDAPWTEQFRDIEGDGKPAPRFQTRAKVLWDDGALYIGAELRGTEIWGHVTRRDAVIFRDNDFEIFIDPDSDTHVYAEFEMNVLNTVWDLLLTKPYRDGGRPINSFDIKGLETAVAVEGEINRPRADNRRWSLEVKMPFESLLECCGQGASLPAPGDFWRVNFSRVQWPVDISENGYEKRINPATGKPCPEDNWVWAPTGLVNIHYPELWGFLFFCREDETFAIPPDEYLKWDLRRVYYREHAIFDETGAFSPDVQAEGIDIELSGRDFTLSCPSSDGKTRLLLRRDGLVERVYR